MTISAPAPLAAHHRLDDFDSGTPLLDDWLKRRARANQENGASRTFVVATEDQKEGMDAFVEKRQPSFKNK